MNKGISITVLAMALLGASQAFAQATYKKDIPDTLAKKAKVSEDVAAKAAMARVLKGEIQSVELEEEDGKLIYSYDIKVPGKSGIEEVNVNAMTGKVLKVEHESAEDESKEAAAEKKAEEKKTPPTKPHTPE